MASQSVSRKRPAPGSTPLAYQQPTPTNGYSNGLGAALSDDQFLQWGQAAQPSNQLAAAPSYSRSTNNVSASETTPSKQLTRRPTIQVASRSRQQELANGAQWSDPYAEILQQPEGPWVDDVEELEKKAQVAKREAQSKRKQIPPFVQKLNSFLEDGKNLDLIRWTEDGASFVVLDEDEFAKTLIPELFKHNNYASFVRQLNMYGFHKKVGLSDNSMRASEKKNKSPSEYSNPYFRRGHPDLLWLIQKPKNVTNAGNGRKGRAKVEVEQADDDADEYGEDAATADPRIRPRTQLAIAPAETALSTEQFQSIQRELNAIRNQQAQISRMMLSLKREHEQLYGQAATFQDQHTRHENSINAILTFLATVYNRSLQGPDGVQGITNLFAGPMSHDNNNNNHLGNVVDVGDYNFDGLQSPDGLPKRFRRAPLLLKAPPPADPPGQTATASPASSTNPYPGRQTRRMSQARQNNTLQQPGSIQEIYGSNASTPTSQPNFASPDFQQQQDMMSMIQNTNARNSLPGTPAADFSNVLNSLQNSDGNTPLTNSQRADVLRLMNSSSNQTGDNALVNSAAPLMPTDYDRRLASTKADIDSLAKLQAEQDKSVQNLTNLLQPLSPTGSIPGIGDGQNLPPPPLDIDDFLNHNDYFTDFPSDGNGNFDFSGANNGNGLNLADLNNGDDDELFGHVPSDAQEPKDQEYSHFGLDGADDEGGGRVMSVASSEVTTPPNTADLGGATTRAKGRRMSAAEGGRSPPKRRKRHS